MRIGHHAIALDASGHSLPDRIWGWDMPVLADFNPCAYDPFTLTFDDSKPVDSLAKAREWAAKVFESDDRVASVGIRQSVQEFDGQPWKEGRHLETIKR